MPRFQRFLGVPNPTHRRLDREVLGLEAQSMGRNLLAIALLVTCPGFGAVVDAAPYFSNDAANNLGIEASPKSAVVRPGSTSQAFPAIERLLSDQSAVVGIGTELSSFQP